MDTYPKNHPQQEERLPMLMKGTIFRTSTGEYTDICEMHDLNSVKEYSLSMNSCTCGTCSPANVRRIHIPPPRIDSAATLPTFRTFSAGKDPQNVSASQAAAAAAVAQQKKIYDTARGLKSVKLVDRNNLSSSTSSTPPAAGTQQQQQYYFQLDANNVHQQAVTSAQDQSGGGPDLVQANKHGDTTAPPQQYIAVPPRAQEKKSS